MILTKKYYNLSDYFAIIAPFMLFVTNVSTWPTAQRENGKKTNGSRLSLVARLNLLQS